MEQRQLQDQIAKTQHKCSGCACSAVGGLVMRTDVRAGLTWDDPANQNQQGLEVLLNAMQALSNGGNTH